MQDHNRGMVLGVQSFGKGSVQTILPMEEGDALRLTTALYFTKNGRSIQAQGITPDIEVENLKLKKLLKAADKELDSEDEDLSRPKESDLPGAIKNPNAKDSNEKKDLKESTKTCLLYTSPSPRDQRGSRMPSSA